MTDDPENAFIARFDLAPTAPGPLDGLRFAVKDLLDVAGAVTGAGSPDWAAGRAPAEAHAPAAARMLAAGARCVGKTHTDELAYSLMGLNAHYGAPTNPAAPGRVPGGSSSGSAAAVAAGRVDFALGTDTGGSVRAPASFCGVFGLRASHGAIPMTGAVPLAPSFDALGWFARDLGIMGRVAAAYGLGEGAAPARLLAPADLWAMAHPETAAALQPMRDALEAAFGPADPAPLLGDAAAVAAARETFRIHQAYEAWTAHGAWIETAGPDLGPGVKERFAAARALSHADFEEVAAARAGIRARLDAALGAGAIALAPTAPGPAPMRDATAAELEADRARLLGLFCAAGLGGLPQLSIPGARAGGAPVGLSLIGGRGRDAALLA
ncbi:MAG: amidase, partial [Pseudomonadota bacterium]